MIGVLVLAAGSSSRMGEDKLLLDLGGESLLRRAARRALEAEVGPVLVVLPAGAARARRELAGLACAPVENPEPERGMNHSLARGLAALPAAAEGAVVLLADMPFVAPAMIRALAQRFRERAPALVASRHGEVLAPPVLYGRSLFAELASGPDGDGQGQQTVRAHLDRAEVLAWPAGALVDVDDPAALARARARLAGEDRRGDPSGS